MYLKSDIVTKPVKLLLTLKFLTNVIIYRRP